MSQWTHVHGIVRVDTLMGLAMLGDPKKAIEYAFGELPAGSEGPIRMDVVETRNHSSLNWGYAAFAGDLREFGLEDVKSIEEWLRASLKRLTERMCLVRNFVLVCDVEYGPEIIFHGDQARFERREFEQATQEVKK